MEENKAFIKIMLLKVLLVFALVSLVIGLARAFKV
jgi:hypothetical protein